MTFQRFRQFSTLTALGLIVGLVLGWAQFFAPFFDAFSVFRLHLCILLALVMLPLLICRSWLWLSASALTLAASIWLILPYLPHQNLPDRDGGRVDLSVVQFNSRWDNALTDLAMDRLMSIDADVYLLQELHDKTLPILERLKQTHPYLVQCTKGQFLGSVGLASRLPLDPDFEVVCNRKDGLAAARILTKNGPVLMVSIHLHWPWPGQQHAQVNRLSKQLSTMPKSGPLVLGGDFNATPWADITQRVANLTGSQALKGLRFTWEPRFPHLHIPLGLVLPIDQVLARKIVAVDRRVLPFAGSDHRPVVTRFRFEG